MLASPSTNLESHPPQSENLDSDKPKHALRAAPPAETNAALSDLPSPEELGAERYRELLAVDDAERAAGDPFEGLEIASLREPSEEDAEGMREDHFGVYGEWLEDDLEVLRKAAARQDTKVVAGDVRVKLHRYGVRYDAKDPRHREFALAILSAAVEAAEAKLARQSGRIIRTPEAVPPIKGPKLSEAFAHWQEGSAAQGGRRVSEK